MSQDKRQRQRTARPTTGELPSKAKDIRPRQGFRTGHLEYFRPSAEILTSSVINPNTTAVETPPLYDVHPLETTVRQTHGEFAFTTNNEVLHFAVGYLENTLQASHTQKSYHLQQRGHREGRSGHSQLLYVTTAGRQFCVPRVFSPGDLLAQVEIRSIVNSYVTAKRILNSQDQAYVNRTEDPILLDALSDLKASERKQLQEIGLLRRNEVIDEAIKKQPWYEIAGEGKDSVVKDLTSHSPALLTPASKMVN